MKKRYIIQKISAILFCLALGILSPSHLFAQQNDETTVFDAIAQRKFDHFFHLALHEKALGNYAEAFDFLLHSHALAPTNADVLVELGMLLNAIDEKEVALSFFHRALQLGGTDFYHKMMLAELSQDLELWDIAIDIYTRLLEADPENIELYFDLVAAHIEIGNLQEAINTLNRIEELIGTSETISLHKFHLFLMMDEQEQAFNEIKRMIAENPSDPRFLVLMGDLYTEDNQHDRAIEYYLRAREVAPDFPPLILSIINHYIRTNNREAAQSELKQAITESALDVETKMQLLTRYIGILHQAREELAQANSLFHALLEQYPAHSPINFVFANVLMMQENREEAVKHFEIFVRANPTNPFGYEELLRIALDEQDLDRVIAISIEALQHLPQKPQFYFYLGSAKFQQGQYEEALQVFKEGLEKAVFPNPVIKSMFFGQIGDLYHFLGEQEKSFEHYEKALGLNPMNLHVLNNFSYFLALARRDLQRAEHMSGITIRAEPTNPTFLDTYGWVLYQQGEYRLARIYLERAMEHSRDNPSAVIYEQFGDVLYKTGEPERALKMWKRARELGGDSEWLNKKIETGEYHSQWQ